MNFFKRNDLFILLCIFLVCAVFIAEMFFSPPEKVRAIIYSDDIILKEIDLNDNDNYYFSPEKNDNVIIYVHSGKIGFYKSNCKDKICINTGMINKSGQCAVCLPNNLIIKIESDKDGVDIVI